MNTVYLDIIIFAAIAVFLLFKLRDVLGETTEEDKQPPSARGSNARQSQNDGKPHPGDRAARGMEGPLNGPNGWPGPLPDYNVTATATVHHELVAIHQSYPDDIDPEHFLFGARRAFSMIVTAFAQGDTDTLKNLLDDDLYKEYAAIIEKRRQRGEAWSTDIRAIKTAVISDADTQASVVQLTVDFVSDQAITARDASGNIIDGYSGQRHTVRDRWIFENDMADDNDIWVLTDTQLIED